MISTVPSVSPAAPKSEIDYREAHAKECAAHAVALTDTSGAQVASTYLAVVLRRLLGELIDAGLSESEAEAEGRQWASAVQAAILSLRPGAKQCDSIH